MTHEHVLVSLITVAMFSRKLHDAYFYHLQKSKTANSVMEQNYVALAIKQIN